MRRTARIAAVMAALLVAGLMGAPPASAEVPSNDAWANATVITDADLPYEAFGSTSEATSEATDPECWGVDPSVWFSYTPGSDALVQANIELVSSYDAALCVYTGNPSDGFVEVAAIDYAGQFAVTAGTTYSLMVNGWYGQAGDFGLRMEAFVAPSNQSPETATALSQADLPTSFSQDTRGSTGTTPEWCSGYTNAVWYAFSATSDVTLQVDTSGTNYQHGIQFYTGDPGTGLSQEKCVPYYEGAANFRVQAGSTVYVAISGYYESGPLEIAFREGPPPFVIGITTGDGSVSLVSGIATVKGTVTCSETLGTAYVSGTLRQRLTRTAVATGSFSLELPCGPEPTPWSARVTPDGSVPFGSGRADLQARAEGYGAVNYDDDEVVKTIRLKGK